jgi:hypothetical protein
MADRVHWHSSRAAFALRYNVMSLHVSPKQPKAQRAADFLRLSCSPRLGVRQPGYSFHAPAHALYMMVLPGISRAPPPAKCSPHHDRSGLPYGRAVNRRSCRLSGDCIGSPSTRSSRRCATIERLPVNASVRPSQACLKNLLLERSRRTAGLPQDVWFGQRARGVPVGSSSSVTCHPGLLQHPRPEVYMRSNHIRNRFDMISADLPGSDSAGCRHRHGHRTLCLSPKRLFTGLRSAATS